MLTPLAELYRATWRYALACPILFLVPVAAEAAQHVAEWTIGFYGGIGAAHATALSPVRMAFGTLKVLALFAAGFWMVRWIEWCDPRRTASADMVALRSFAPYLLFQAAIAAPEIWGPVVLRGLRLALPGAASAALAILSLALGLLLSDWSRTAPLGTPGGPVRSARLVAPVLPWALAFNLLAIVPPMAVHYALGYGTVAAPGAAKPALLVADTLFVGYLGAIVSGVPWFVSERARRRGRLVAAAPLAA